MDTKELRYFMKVCEEQSMNKAAGQLFITQQGLSKAIANLEQRLNVKLFERTAKGVFPTEEGELLYRKCQNLIDMMDEIEAGVSQIANREKKLTVGYACGVMQVLPFHLIQQYAKEHNGLEIVCEEYLNQDLLDNIEQSKIDIGFVIGKEYSDTLIKKEITRRKMVVLVYPGHPFYDKETISIRELEGEPLITLGDRFYIYHRFKQMCTEYGFKPKVIVKTMESRLIHKLCNDHVGLGLDIDFDNDDYQQEIKKIPIEENFPWIVQIAYKKENKKYPNINSFLNFIEQNM